MILYTGFLLLFFVQMCPANRRVGFHLQTTSPPPRSQGQKSTHISEFTDPATGLNPFLDLEEGRSGGLGRNIDNEHETLPRHLSDSHPQLVEGDPVDRPSSRFNNALDRRQGSINRGHLTDLMMPISNDPSIEHLQVNWGREDPPPVTQSSKSQALPMPFQENVDPLEPDYSPRPAEDHILDYLAEYKDSSEGMVKARKDIFSQDDAAHTEKIPVSKNALIGAAITGACVAVLSLLLVVCWWRQKMKRGSPNTTEGNIESVIGDKVHTNSNFQNKTILP